MSTFTAITLYKVILVKDPEEIGMTGTTSTQTEDFTAVRNLSASPATVSALFASAAGVGRWWGPTEGDAGVGGTLVTSFGDHGVNTMRVLEAGPTRVVWESIASDGTTPTGHAQEWLGTTMEFDIVPAGTGTRAAFPARRPDPPARVLGRLLRRLDVLHGEHRGFRRDRHRHPVRGLRPSPDGRAEAVDARGTRCGAAGAR